MLASDTTPSPVTLTALMPLRNGLVDHARKAVQSMLGQSCPDWRLSIIVEGRDHARLREALATILEDPRVSMIDNEGRRLPGALNTGMRRASTDFVATLLADDMWASDAVAVLARYIGAHPDVDFFHSSRVFVDELDRPISSVYPSRATFTLDDFLITSPVKHLLCWRRAKALSIGGIDESLRLGADDFDFPWSMAERGATFLAVAEPLYLYRDHRAAPRITTHLPRSVQRRELRRILEKHGASEEAIQRRLARASDTYLRQCLFPTSVHKWVAELLRRDGPGGWRMTYR